MTFNMVGLMYILPLDTDDQIVTPISPRYPIAPAAMSLRPRTLGAND